VGSRAGTQLDSAKEPQPSPQGTDRYLLVRLVQVVAPDIQVNDSAAALGKAPMTLLTAERAALPKGNWLPPIEELAARIAAVADVRLGEHGTWACSADAN
jgi:hypothetical protein